MKQDPIEYSLIKRGLPGNEESYSGLIHSPKTITKDKLIDLMVRQGSTFTRPDIQGVLELFYDTIIEELREGHSISTPLFRAELSLKGQFSSVTEKYNGKKHKAHVVFRTAKGLNRKVTSRLRFQRSQEGHTSFELGQPRPQGEDDDFYPGTVILCRGKGLKVYHTKAQYQLELSQKNRPVSEAVILSLSGCRVTASLPFNLKPGEYSLRFIKTFGNSEKKSNGFTFKVKARE